MKTGITGAPVASASRAIPSLVDAVGLELPFAPVCTPDCPGLCPECGVALAAEPGHHHDRIDPRWSKLAEMLPSDPDIPGDER